MTLPSESYDPKKYNDVQRDIDTAKEIIARRQAEENTEKSADVRRGFEDLLLQAQEIARQQQEAEEGETVDDSCVDGRTNYETIVDKGSSIYPTSLPSLPPLTFYEEKVPKYLSYTKKPIRDEIFNTEVMGSINSDKYKELLDMILKNTVSYYDELHDVESTIENNDSIDREVNKYEHNNLLDKYLSFREKYKNDNNATY